jgi:Ca2+-binding RTX toxin-like protein
MAYIQGTAADDRLSGLPNDVLEGGAGNDTLSGGNVIFQGASDTVTVVYNRGDGDDTLDFYLLSGRGGNFGPYGYHGNYVVQFGAGITLADLVFNDNSVTGNGPNVMSFRSGPGSLSFTEMPVWRFSDGLELNNIEAMNWFNLGVLAEGPNYNIDLSRLSSVPTPRLVRLEGGQDTVLGSVSADSMAGAGGNDVLRGAGGSDTLSGDQGNDWLEGGTGDDLIYAREGQDTVFQGMGDSGPLGDVLEVGSDVTLRLGSGLKASDMKLLVDTRTVNATTDPFLFSDFTMSFNGGKDVIHVHTNSFSRDAAAKVEFDDGSSRSMVSLLDQVNTKPIPGKLLSGGALSDTLQGTAGNDTLQGLGGKDYLAGDLGDDLLVGGKGSDTYFIAERSGHDTIVENESSLLATDVLQFAYSSSKQLWFQRAGNDLKVSVIGTQDDVTVQGWFSSSNARVEKILASDGKTLTAAKVQGLVNAMASFAPPPLGTTSLPASTPASITKVVASSWA